MADPDMTLMTEAQFNAKAAVQDLKLANHESWLQDKDTADEEAVSRIENLETTASDNTARLNGKPLPAGQNFHDLALVQGPYIMPAPTDWAAQNMPNSARGQLDITVISSTNRVLTYRTSETVPRLFIKAMIASAWGAWREINPLTYDTRLGLLERGNVLSATQDFHDTTLAQGTHIMFSPTNWTAQNMPSNARGELDVTLIGPGYRTLFYRTTESTPRLFIKGQVADVWGTWREIGKPDTDTRIAALETSTTALKAVPATRPSGLKTVPLQLTLGTSPVLDAATTGTARYVMKYAAPLFRVRVNIQNVHPSSGAKRAGAVSFTGLWAGKHAGSGAFTGTPARIANAFSTPADGSKWTSKWFYPAQTPGVEDLLSVGYTASNGSVSLCDGDGYFSADSTQGGETAAAGIAPASTMPFYVWLEAETYATTPHIGVHGDSLSSGVGAGGVRYSWLTQYCEARGALPTHYSNSGDWLKAWADDLNSFKWTMFDGLSRPDALIMAMGSNDIFNDTTLAQIQASFGIVYPQMASRICQNIYLANILPRNADTGARETVRRDYNAWLASLPYGARDYFNFAGAISDDDETILPAYNAGGVHLNAAGYGKLAAAITRPVTTPPVTYQTV
jgi:lysophospholipase L1-like esterase